MADKRKEYNDWLKANPKATKEEKDAKIAELQAKDKEEKEVCKTSDPLGILHQDFIS